MSRFVAALAAGVALLIGASNLSIMGINSTFWAIVVGVALAKFLQQGSDEQA